MKKQYIIKIKIALSVILLILYTVFVFLIEDIFLPSLGLKMPVYLLIPMTISVAMNLETIPALFYGIFTGIMFDIISTSPDGIYALIFALSSFICSELTKNIFRNSRNVAFFFSVIFTFIICLISFITNFISGDSSSAHIILKGFYLPALIVTTLVSPIFYPVSAKIIGIKK